MGKYGTNLEGFGAFEGGVNADKGAPLVSTSSDGETALLFGPAALREIQAGVANGDFAIPPDAAGDTITAENPLPYWTFTDVNSAGAITCAVVADASAGSGNVLRFTIANNTVSGRSAKLTRYIPVASSRDRASINRLIVGITNIPSTANANVTITQQYVKADLTNTGTAGTTTNTFAQLATAAALFTAGVVPFGVPGTQGLTFAAPSDAAYILLTITVATVTATVTPARTIDFCEVRMIMGTDALSVAEAFDPATYYPASIYQENGVLKISNGATSTSSKVQVLGELTISGANSEYVARIAYTTTQSLTNNTSTKLLFNTASATPDIGSYDPQGWFNNANDSIDIGQDGFYAVAANVAFAANTTGRREIAIAVNGTVRASVNISAASASTTNLSVSTNLYLVVGDEVTVSALQTSGGALNTANVAGVFPALSLGRIGA